MIRNKPYYPLLFNPTTAILTATGDGSGVATLSIQVSANTQVTISDNGNFYTDAEGTLGETKVWNVTSGAMRTIYLKVTSGTAKLTFAERRLVTHWGDTGSSGWVRSTNAPSIAALEALRSAFPNLLELRLDSEAGFVDELQDLPRELTHIYITGSNTISGSLADAPADLTYILIYGSNTISGSLADAPADLTHLYIYGNNTISGSLADAPADLTQLRIYGSNTISGSLADAPADLTYILISGSNTISGSLADAPADLTYILIYGSNTISGSLADAPTGLTQIIISGSNTISGSLADAPTGLTQIIIYGSNTISGSLADAPTGLTYLLISGSNTISGSLADAPADLTQLYITGSNTISGSLADAPADLTHLRIYGSNTISGSLADAPADLTYIYISGSNTISDYTQGKVFANNFNRLQIDGVGGLSQSEMIDLIVDISAATWGGSSRTFSMSSPHADMSDTTQGGIWGDFSGTDDPSALATAYKTLIKTKSVSVTLNGITVPGTSGDGTGFPAGFGDWYRT
jgi:hypothetical protein